ncbi:MAG: hypothetical protein DRJ41_00060 [Thermoprotei archaeon]|nr:MAG: hypothetical protein DRJ41_00060 [Thermoprotei archaeon]
MESLREEILRVTLKIVELIAKRNSLAREIARLKSPPTIRRYDVELKVLKAAITRARELGVEPSLIKRVVGLLIESSAREQGEDLGRPEVLAEIFLRAKELEKSGKSVVHLEVGEPDYSPPKDILEFVYRIKGKLGYGHPLGLEELREHIADYISRKYGVKLGLENIAITPGGKYAIYATLRSFLSMGDRVMVIYPAYPPYTQLVRFVGATIVPVFTSLENEWIPDEDKLSKAARSCRAIILNSPSNPTGAVYSFRFIKRVAELAAEQEAYIISDEVYSDLTFTTYHSMVEVGYERCVTIGSFSKSFGMPGYRLGYIIASDDAISKISQTLSLTLTCPPVLAQLAGLEAIKRPELVEENRKVLERRVRVAAETLDEEGLNYSMPKGGLYVFPRIGVDSYPICMRALMERGVALAPGIAFGPYDHFIRISLGTREEDIERGIKTVARMIRG